MAFSVGMSRIVSGKDAVHGLHKNPSHAHAELELGVPRGVVSLCLQLRLLACYVVATGRREG